MHTGGWDGAPHLPLPAQVQLQPPYQILAPVQQSSPPVDRVGRSIVNGLAQAPGARQPAPILAVLLLLSHAFSAPAGAAEHK